MLDDEHYKHLCIETRKTNHEFILPVKTRYVWVMSLLWWLTQCYGKVAVMWRLLDGLIVLIKDSIAHAAVTKVAGHYKITKLYTVLSFCTS